MIDTTKEKERLDFLEKLNKKYPDIQMVKSRWGKEYYCTSSINDKITHVGLWHNCGCCHDSPLEARPYIFDKDLNIEIYGHPIPITVGEKEDLLDRPYPDWEEKIKKHYPENVVKIIQKHFTPYEDNS